MAADDTTPLLPASLREEVLTLRVLLPMGQQQVWEHLTDPALLAAWSPVVPDRALTSEGPATSREDESQESVDASVETARGPWQLCHRWGTDRLTWQLAPSGEQTQVNLVHEMSEPTRAAEMAAGWHLCLGVLTALGRGEQVSRIVGQDAVAAGWAELRERYAADLGADDVD